MKDNLNYIPDDGYTESGYIEAKDLLYSEFRFTFRPMLTEEVSQLVASLDKLAGDAYDRKAADVMAGQLASWWLPDATGANVTISPKAMLQVKPALFNRLYRIILGQESTDIDPEWATEAAIEEEKEQYESALSDKPPGEVREETDAKNSDAG